MRHDRRTPARPVWATTIDPADAISPEALERAKKVERYLREIEDDALMGDQWTFITELRERMERDGDAIRITDAQYGWVKGIWEKQNGMRPSKRRR